MKRPETTNLRVSSARKVVGRARALVDRLRLTPPGQYYLSEMGRTRHIQHAREAGERQNPDHLVGKLLAGPDRRLAQQTDIEELRARPFYHYLLARTRFYDAALRAGIAEGFRQVFVFGVGLDTRAFRFAPELDAAGVRVIETDLEPWISRRARLVKRLKAPRDYACAELNIEAPDLAAWSAARYDLNLRTLFIAEGVTPHLQPAALPRLLEFVSKGPPESRLVYDAKLAGADDNPSGLFRMPRDGERVAALHREHSLKIADKLHSAGVQQALLGYETPVFDEDVIIVAARE